ncbi:riboflavin synthase subunit alpha [Alkanindiges hydrocarboniclasticus]|jgi:riboflavin synthase|uniref:Riboflavin synthase n=1 Tax=Alkanindiges hydrocarboniclasticus TaxID=1907941 RepID=A0A1S8CQZ7_9GAMM|nr:riboflavin synthase [Alkanindiges hydrocarboniclasticus]ONG37902.1 riboflavin synthase subunit alpha [Alkanindiges hydrocarboniclasticus]
MFTGIIEAVGKVLSVSQTAGDVRLVIHAAGLDMGDVKLGDSIATSGVCLTVIDFGKDWYAADVSLETISRTSLLQWKTGTSVNLEKALLPTTRLGGHLVSGHVDGLGEITLMRKDARSLYFEVKAPDELARYLAEKGSITVDGISLTINHLNGATLSLNLVPHTAEQTTIKEWQVGSKVNLEVDVLARYLERLLLGDKAAQATVKSGIDMSFLAENGFLR